MTHQIQHEELRVQLISASALGTPSAHGTPEGREAVSIDLDLLVDRIAERLLERVQAAAGTATAPGVHALVDASTVARSLGVSRQWVYEHRDELGAQRLGDGSRPRLRFDLDQARKVFACSLSRTSQAEDRLCEADSATAPLVARRRVPKRVAEPGSVLAIRPPKGASHAA
jgi:hypothetical protein